jgi:hypothetical protein
LLRKCSWLRPEQKFIVDRICFANAHGGQFCGVQPPAEQTPSEASLAQQSMPTQLWLTGHGPNGALLQVHRGKMGVDRSAGAAAHGPSLQVPAQQRCVLLHTALPQWHCPPLQVPSPHSRPHAPQLKRSVSRLLQPAVPQQLCAMPQAVPVGGQPQRPTTHTLPVGQALLQSPQFFGSLSVSVQVWPQHLPMQFSGCAGHSALPPPS